MQDDLLSYETDLASLYEPFGNLMVAYRNQGELKQSNVSQTKAMAISKLPPSKFYKKNEKLNDFILIKKAGVIDKITLLLFGFYLFLTMMNLWNRACFIDVKAIYFINIFKRSDIRY